MVLSLRIIAENTGNTARAYRRGSGRARSSKAHDEQVVALQRLIAQLDPVGTAFNRLVEQQKQLNEAKLRGCFLLKCMRSFLENFVLCGVSLRLLNHN